MCGAGDQFLQNVVGCVLKCLVKKKKRNSLFIHSSWIWCVFGRCDLGLWSEWWAVDRGPPSLMPENCNDPVGFGFLKEVIAVHTT